MKDILAILGVGILLIIVFMLVVGLYISMVLFYTMLLHNWLIASISESIILYF